jgi:alkylation response protein AidB-like acyl-CoA dehydrogenase
VAFTEPGTGSDPKAITTVAKLKGNSYILSGEKSFATMAPGAKVSVIFAKDDTGRVSAFVVENDSPGFKVGKHWDTLGLRGSGTCPLYLTDVSVPADNMLGEKGKGYDMLLQGISVGQMGMTAEGLGVSQAALEMSVEYAKNRIVRGAPMTNLPTVQVELAEMATKLEAARYLLYHAAWLKDQGKNVHTAAAMAKLFGGEVAVRCTSLGMQIHGSYGYCKDYDIERFYRDAKACQIVEVVSEVLHLIVAQSLIK